MGRVCCVNIKIIFYTNHHTVTKSVQFGMSIKKELLLGSKTNVIRINKHIIRIKKIIPRKGRKEGTKLPSMFSKSVFKGF